MRPFLISILTLVFASTLTISNAAAANSTLNQQEPHQQEPRQNESTAPKFSSTPAKNAYLDRLFTSLANATNETEARRVEDEIWKSWIAHPLPDIRDMITKAMEARRWYDFEKARILLTNVVKMAPEYAEGWNQRAFILFLQEKYDQSLSDLEHALALEPRHFGALAGQARIMMRQGRFATGQKILKQAVKIHPFLNERSMIVDTGEKEI